MGPPGGSASRRPWHVDRAGPLDARLRPTPRTGALSRKARVSPGLGPSRLQTGGSCRGRSGDPRRPLFTRACGCRRAQAAPAGLDPRAPPAPSTRRLHLGPAGVGSGRKAPQAPVPASPPAARSRPVAGSAGTGPGVWTHEPVGVPAPAPLSTRGVGPRAVRAPQSGGTAPRVRGRKLVRAGAVHRRGHSV